jgi:hypothetical protein
LANNSSATLIRPPKKRIELAATITVRTAGVCAATPMPRRAARSSDELSCSSPLGAATRAPNDRVDKSSAEIAKVAALAASSTPDPVKRRITAARPGPTT